MTKKETITMFILAYFIILFLFSVCISLTTRDQIVCPIDKLYLVDIAFPARPIGCFVIWERQK